MDVAATAFIDEQLLTALGLVNMDMKEEYRQLVLLGCGLDTRPYRFHQSPPPTPPPLIALDPLKH